jgi:hypothetical protein
MSSMYIDGDIFITEGGLLERFTSGKSDGWEPDELEDTLLRPEPRFEQVAGAGERRGGSVYAFDPRSSRVVAFDKANGDYREQYRLMGDDQGWDGLRGMYVIPGVDEAPAKLVWLSASGLHEATLATVDDDAAASAAPSAGASGSPEGDASSPAP